MRIVEPGARGRADAGRVCGVHAQFSLAPPTRDIADPDLADRLPRRTPPAPMARPACHPRPSDGGAAPSLRCVTCARNLAYLVWTGDDRSLSVPYALTTVSLGVPVPLTKIVIFGASLAATVGLYFAFSPLALRASRPRGEPGPWYGRTGRDRRRRDLRPARSAWAPRWGRSEASCCRRSM